MEIVDEQLISTKSLAQKLDVKETTVRDWVYKKCVPYYKRGGMIRFKLSEILGTFQKVNPTGAGLSILEEMKLNEKI